MEAQVFQLSLRTHKYLSMSEEIIPSSLIKLVKFPVQLALNSSKLYHKTLNLIFNHVCKFKNPFTTVMMFSGFYQNFGLTVQNFEFTFFFFFLVRPSMLFQIQYNTIQYNTISITVFITIIAMVDKLSCLFSS